MKIFHPNNIKYKILHKSITVCLSYKVVCKPKSSCEILKTYQNNMVWSTELLVDDKIYIFNYK